MHGKQFLIDGVYAGIDEQYVFGRLDFAGKLSEDAFELVVNVTSWANQATEPTRDLRLDVTVERRRMQGWKVTKSDGGVLAKSTDPNENEDVRVALARNFEFRLPLTWLLAAPLDLQKVRGSKSADSLTTHLRLRFSLWKNRLPADALPLEGCIELELLAEEDLLAVGG
jgi:hypothetical protein